MRTATCDHCGTSTPLSGFKRPSKWSAVRLCQRSDERGATDDVISYELCTDCTAEITIYLTKAGKP